MKLPTGFSFSVLMLAVLALMMMGVTGWCLAQPSEEKRHQNFFHQRGG